jgi:hypothetical protein
VYFERYTRVLREASPEFPIHFLKIYRLVALSREYTMSQPLKYLYQNNLAKVSGRELACLDTSIAGKSCGSPFGKRLYPYLSHGMSVS